MAEREQKEAAERAEKAKETTFAQAAREYIAKHEDEWTNAKHRAQWRATFEKATKAINDLPVSAIETPHVIKVLQPIWQKTPETASRVRMRIEAVLSYAKVAGYRTGENPARWGGIQSTSWRLNPRSRKGSAKLQDDRNTSRHSRMPNCQLLWPSWNNNSISARALEWTILTAARTNETLGATFAEIDLGRKTWTIPAMRMKAAREHIVPLSGRAVELLERSTRSDYLFPGAQQGRPLSNMAMLELVRGTIGNGYTVHGFRSAFRDWCREQTSFPRELAELALAHVNKDKTEEAYARGPAVDRRRRLMDAWGKFCMSNVTGDAKVVPIRGRGQG